MGTPTQEPTFNQSTAQFSKIAGVQADSIRVRLCKTGSYFGIKPIKLRNGRLLWPDNSRELLEGGDA